MDLVVGSLALAGLVFIFLRLKSSISVPLDSLRFASKRHFFKRAEFAEGQRLVSHQIVFHSDFDIDAVRESILAQIQPVSSLSVLQPNFVVERSDDELIVFECGNKLQSFFKGALTLSKADFGVDGSWTIISWLRHDGVVAAREPMKQIVRRIHTGVVNVDPGARFELIPLERSPRIVANYDFDDSVQVDYVQDFEAGIPAVA